MELKGFKELTSGFAVCEKKELFSLQEEFAKAQAKIKNLKSDKQKLQNALRNVIAERNAKSEKFQELKEKQEKLESFLKKEADFIKDFRVDYLEMRRGGKNGKLKKEIEKAFENVMFSLKSRNLHLKYDENFEGLIGKAIKLEKWEETCMHLLNFTQKSIKKPSEYNEEDTPQFIKLKPEDKINKFIENSKILLESLAEQQDKLEKLSKNYYQGSIKHVKTASVIPSSVKILTSGKSTRNVRSSLGEPIEKSSKILKKRQENLVSTQKIH